LKIKNKNAIVEELKTFENIASEEKMLLIVNISNMINIILIFSLILFKNIYRVFILFFNVYWNKVIMFQERKGDHHIPYCDRLTN